VGRADEESAMSGAGAGQFSAADAAVGYLYQVRVALLWALRRLKDGSDFLVSLETLDDVTFETKGRPDELLQAKHHRSRQASLSDASPDLWKSLRVWFVAHAAKTVPSDTALHLLTTATAGPGSAASYLRRTDRDVTAALKALETTAQTSGSKENAAAYSAFLSSSTTMRRTVLDAVVVIDAASRWATSIKSFVQRYSGRSSVSTSTYFYSALKAGGFAAC
jgi:hypothetical protein